MDIMKELKENPLLAAAVVVAVGLKTGVIASGYNCPAFLQGTKPVDKP